MLAMRGAAGMLTLRLFPDNRSWRYASQRVAVTDIDQIGFEFAG